MGTPTIVDQRLHREEPKPVPIANQVFTIILNVVIFDVNPFLLCVLLEFSGMRNSYISNRCPKFTYSS